ncbi:hypothetical protein F5X96DRAFT_691271 [Biscogniauxia mediterranea]|nr:hypothetical protein F5X96DRAFT_691271 [Biscogniauxia mediterranea]
MSTKHETQFSVKQEGASKRVKIKQEDFGESALSLGSIPPAPLIPKEETKEDAKPNYDMLAPAYPFGNLSSNQKRKRRRGPPVIKVRLDNGVTCRAHYDTAKRRVLLSVGSLNSGQLTRILDRLANVGFQLEEKPSWIIYSVENSKIHGLDWAFDVNEPGLKEQELKEPSKLAVTKYKSMFEKALLSPFPEGEPALTTSMPLSPGTVTIKPESEPRDSTNTEGVKISELPSDADSATNPFYIDLTDNL